MEDGSGLVPIISVNDLQEAESQVQPVAAPPPTHTHIHHSVARFSAGVLTLHSGSMWEEKFPGWFQQLCQCCNGHLVGQTARPHWGAVNVPNSPNSQNLWLNGTLTKKANNSRLKELILSAGSSSAHLTEFLGTKVPQDRFLSAKMKKCFLVIYTEAIG